MDLGLWVVPLTGGGQTGSRNWDVMIEVWMRNDGGVTGMKARSGEVIRLETYFEY